MHTISLKIILILLILSSVRENRHSDIDNLYLKATNSNNSYRDRLCTSHLLRDKLLTATNCQNTRAWLFLVARNYAALNQWDSFRNLVLNIRAKSEVSSDSAHIVKSFLYMGNYHMNTSDNVNALKYYTASLKWYKKRGDYQSLPYIYLNLGHLYYYVCDYSSAETLYLKVLASAPIQSGLRYEAYLGVAVLSRETGNFNASFRYYQKAMNVLTSTKSTDKHEYARLKHGLAYTHETAGNFSVAENLYRESLENIKDPNSCPELYSRILDDLAHSLFQQGKLTYVESFYKKAAKIRDNYGIQSGSNYNKLFQSEYYLRLKDGKKAKKYALEALQISKNFKSPNDVLKSFGKLIRVDSSDASKYALQYIKINDSLQLAERRNRNKFARIAFETDEIIKEKNTAIQQKWIILSCALLIILTGSLAFIVMVQRNRQKEMLFVHEQQKSNESIYRLIHDQQLKIEEGRSIEKTRIARELHDGVMNRLASTRLNLFILNKKKDEQTVDRCIPYINGIREIEKEIRQVAHDLDNDIFAGKTTFNLILDNLFASHEELDNAKIHREIDPNINWEAVDSAIKMNLYRILQEALQNCYKYAKADNIYLTMKLENGRLLRVTIQDDGTGFETKRQKSGIGIKNMKNRVKILNGSFRITSASTNGTVINMTIPIINHIQLM